MGYSNQLEETAIKTIPWIEIVFSKIPEMVLANLKNNKFLLTKKVPKNPRLIIGKLQLYCLSTPATARIPWFLSRARKTPSLYTELQSANFEKWKWEKEDLSKNFALTMSTWMKIIFADPVPLEWRVTGNSALNVTLVKLLLGMVLRALVLQFKFYLEMWNSVWSSNSKLILNLLISYL